MLPVLYPDKACPEYSAGPCAALTKALGVDVVATGLRCKVCQRKPDAMPPERLELIRRQAQGMRKPTRPPHPGRARWRAFHLWTREAKAETPEQRREALQRIRTLANGMEGCSCNAHWARYVRDNPPDLANLWQWGVDAHNAVNKRLGKPILSADEALATL